MLFIKCIFYEENYEEEIYYSYFGFDACIFYDRLQFAGIDYEEVGQLH